MYRHPLQFLSRVQNLYVTSKDWESYRTHGYLTSVSYEGLQFMMRTAITIPLVGPTTETKKGRGILGKQKQSTLFYSVNGRVSLARGSRSYHMELHHTAPGLTNVYVLLNFDAIKRDGHL